MRGLIVALAIGFAALPLAPAVAMSSFGSAIYASQRHCATLPHCTGLLGPGNGGGFSLFFGGNGKRVVSNTTLADGSYVRGTATFGSLGLPILSGETRSNSSVYRFNLNDLAYQSYRFNGPSGTPFSITSSLHIDDSSTDGRDGYHAPGGAQAGQFTVIWKLSAVPSLMTPYDILVGLEGFCGTPGVLATGNDGGVLPGGATSYTATTTSCAGGSLLLNHGDRILVGTILDLPVVPGGFIDATHTAVTRLGDDLSDATKAILTANLQTSIPEPETWTLMLIGFAAIGVLVRRARHVAADDAPHAWQ